MSLSANIQNPSGSNQPILAMADSTSWENYSVEEWERWAAEPITGGVPAPMRPGWTATWKRPVPAASALPPAATAADLGSVRLAQRRPNGGLVIKYHRRSLYPEWEGHSLPTPEEILGEEAAEARRLRNQAEEAIAEQEARRRRQQATRRRAREEQQQEQYVARCMRIWTSPSPSPSPPPAKRQRAAASEASTVEGESVGEPEAPPTPRSLDHYHAEEEGTPTHYGAESAWAGSDGPLRNLPSDCMSIDYSAHTGEAEMGCGQQWEAETQASRGSSKARDSQNWVVSWMERLVEGSVGSGSAIPPGLEDNQEPAKEVGADQKEETATDRGDGERQGQTQEGHQNQGVSGYRGVPKSRVRHLQEKSRRSRIRFLRGNDMWHYLSYLNPHYPWYRAPEMPPAELFAPPFDLSLIQF